VLEKYFHSQPLPHKHHKNSKNVPNQGHCFEEIALDSHDHCHGKSPGHLGGCGISQNAYWKARAFFAFPEKKGIKNNGKVMFLPHNSYFDC